MDGPDNLGFINCNCQCEHDSQIPKDFFHRYSNLIQQLSKNKKIRCELNPRYYLLGR